MKLIRLNSYNHYEIYERGGKKVLREYPDACPGMGDREPYQHHEGTDVDEWPADDEVEFYYPVQCVPQTTDGKALCGDDFGWHLRGSLSWQDDENGEYGYEE